MRNAPCLLLFATWLAPACADYNLMERTGDFATDSGQEADANTGRYLRVDVYPSDASEDLLPQTIYLAGSTWEGVEVAMQSKVRVWGTVDGFEATPHVDASVPGRNVPVEAHVDLVAAGTITSVTTRTDPADGSYTLYVPPGDGYLFSVVPENPAELPFHVLRDREFLSGRYLSVHLDYGSPIWGRVADGLGRPVVGQEVQALDVMSGVEGPIVTTDSLGYYLLRVEYGEYDVRFRGPEGSFQPTLVHRTLVEGDEGSQVNATYGSLEPISVRGEVVDRGGQAVGDVLVRFTSASLYNNPAGTLVVETETDPYGKYSAELLEGQYLVEFLPPYQVACSPTRSAGVDVPQVAGVLDLGETELLDFLTLEAVLQDPQGFALANVNVTAEQTDFGGYVYNVVSDANGNISLSLPRSDYAFTFNPPPESGAAATRLEVSAAGLPTEIDLPAGNLVSGVVTHDDAPVAYALVDLRDSDGNLYVSTVTDETGAFAVRIEWNMDDDGWMGE